ncbi:hypothetical protein RND81_05G258200 [Saponaria officinalis]|uniref:FHA domain-containing protein n=1 Tax=Saponaria officinalis TaxID=3572 RepID=A0AAW1KWP3_SAPOF
METIAAKSLLYAKNCKPLTSPTCISPSFLQCKTCPLSYQSAGNIGFRRLRLHCTRIIIKHEIECTRKNVGVVHASSNGGTTSAGVTAQGWLLEPVGDGDYKHIGFKVEMPGAYEIFSREMIVGRVPDKADLVIPVATVSGLHARVQNKEGNLLVTDLDSTNGTFINEKRVPPGATALVPPGSLLTFGDTHLAIFRVSRLEKTIEETASDTEEQPQTDGASAAKQSEES